jgi:hypothetical protein
MNRRGFLGALAAAIAGATLDPESLVWQPGRKLISIPKPPFIPEPSVSWLRGFLNQGDRFTVEGRYSVDPKTLKLLPYLQQFVVIAVSPDGGLNGVLFQAIPIPQCPSNLKRSSATSNPKLPRFPRSRSANGKALPISRTFRTA